MGPVHEESLCQDSLPLYLIVRGRGRVRLQLLLSMLRARLFRNSSSSSGSKLAQTGREPSGFCRAMVYKRHRGAPRGQRHKKGGSLEQNKARKTKLINQNVWLRFHPPTDVIVVTSHPGHPINSVCRRWAGGGIVCFSARLSHCLNLGANARRRWFSPTCWRVFREGAQVQGRRPLRVGPQCAGVVPCVRVCVLIKWHRSTPVAQSAPRNLLTRWDVSSIPANGIFLTKN